jgi:hypothetical protein
MDPSIAARIVAYLGGSYAPTALALRAASRVWRELIPAPPHTTRAALVRRAGREGSRELLECALDGELREYLYDAHSLALYNGMRYEQWKFCEEIIARRTRYTMAWGEIEPRYGRLAFKYSRNANIMAGVARGGNLAAFQQMFDVYLRVPTAINIDGYIALALEKAARSSHVHIIQFIRAVCQSNNLTFNENYVLIGAARHEHAELVRETLARMIATGARIKWKYVIANALCSRDLTIARELLDRIAQYTSSVPWPSVIEMIAQFGPADYFARVLELAPPDTASAINWHTVRENARKSGDAALQEYVRCAQLA